VEIAKYALKNWGKSLNIAKNLRINEDFFFNFQYLNGNFGTKNVNSTKEGKTKQATR